MLSASLSSLGDGFEWMASWGGVVALAGVFSGGETMDSVGDGDLGGIEGCTNSVKPEVEDMVMSEYWMIVV